MRNKWIFCLHKKMNNEKIDWNWLQSQRREIIKEIILVYKVAIFFCCFFFCESVVLLFHQTDTVRTTWEQRAREKRRGIISTSCKENFVVFKLIISHRFIFLNYKQYQAKAKEVEKKHNSFSVIENKCEINYSIQSFSVHFHQSSCFFFSSW